MNNIKIKFKILVIVVASLLCILVASTYIILGFLHTRGDAKNDMQIAIKIINQNAFIHEFQKERGYSAGFLGGNANRENLDNQRKAVDETILKLENKSEILPIISDLRKRVDSKEGIALLSKFTQIIKDNIVLIKKYGSGFGADLVDDLERLLKITEIKESYGLLRATVNAALNKKEFSNSQFNTVVALNGIINKFTSDFYNFAQDQYTQKFDTIVAKTKYYEEVGDIVSDIIQDDESAVLKYEAKQWFSTATNLIDEFRNFELFLINDMQNESAKIYTFANEKLIYMVVLVTVATLLLLFSSGFIVRNLITNIEATKDGLTGFFDFLNNKTSKANLLELKGKDELCQMATLINENIRKVEANLNEQNDFINAANVFVGEIQSGNYTACMDAKTTNPALNYLKDAFGLLSKSLQDGIAKNSAVIFQTIERLKNQDFSARTNDSGLVAAGMDLLGNEIAKMLQTNLDQAEILQQKAQ
ncbi:MAG: nitrate- and nitrite sensing domain-containing protein, partial [Campylobacter sp.]